MFGWFVIILTIVILVWYYEPFSGTGPAMFDPLLDRDGFNAPRLEPWLVHGNDRF